MAGGNTKYTAGAKRFADHSSDDLLPLLAHADDPRVGQDYFYLWGLRLFGKAEVLDIYDAAIPGLFACEELAGGVFLDSYPSRFCLTSSAVFGPVARAAAARC